jgi:polysaccharide export outer membrane protein
LHGVARPSADSRWRHAPIGAIAWRALTAALGAAPAALQAQSAEFSQGTLALRPAEPTLSPGDVVRITVWRKPELSGEFTVASDGSITHPLYRAVKVAGVPFSEAEARVRALLAHLDSVPQFVMEPLLKVTVGGEVAKPSLYTLSPETTIAQAIALAGGPTELGRRDRARVLRNERELVVDLSRPGADRAQMPIHSEDQIFVERRKSLWSDFIAPAVTLTGATAAILTVVLRKYPR